MGIAHSDVRPYPKRRRRRRAFLYIIEEEEEEEEELEEGEHFDRKGSQPLLSRYTIMRRIERGGGGERNEKGRAARGDKEALSKRASS